MALPSAQLGHANIAMTLDLYSHVTADLRRDAVDRLEALITSLRSGGGSVNKAWFTFEPKCVVSKLDKQSR